MRKFAFFVVLAAIVWASIALALSPAQKQLLWQSSSQIHDGISLDFAANRFYVKAPGQPARFDKFANLFIFTRNSVGTFLGSNGLIQYANSNLWLQSQTLDSASWALDRTTVTANSTTAPDGTATADSINEDGTSGVHDIRQSATTAGLVYTLSVYLKQANRQWAFLQLGSGVAYFDLAACASGTVSAGYAATVSSSGNGWCRVSITGGNAAATNQFGPAEADNDNSFAGLTQASTYAWGAQAQNGVQAGTYLPTVAAVKYDQHRIGYDTSGNLLGLLSENSITNVALWSEDFTNAVWVNTNTTDAANSAIAPDGNTTADTVTASAANGLLTQSFSSTSNAARPFGVYLKRNSGSGTVTVEVGRTVTTCTVNFSWNRCSALDTVLAGTYAVVSNVVTVTATGHGLNSGDAVRLDYTSGTATDFDCASVTVLTADTYTCAQTTADTTGNVNTFASTGRIKIATNGDSVFAWGGQSDLNGGLISSYIPTTSAAVTRAIDVALRTDTPTVWNTTQGTMVASFITPQVTATGQYGLMEKNDSGSVDGAALFRITTTCRMNDSTTTITKGTIVAGSLTRCASSWGPAGLAITLGGQTVSTGAFDGSLGDAASQIVVGSGTTAGSNQLDGHLQKIELWPVQMPNSFLQQKTQPGPQSALDWPHYAANDNALRAAA